MDARQMLTEARQMILAPEHWTRGQLARTAAGRPVPPDDENAQQWCALGALGAVAHPVGMSVAAATAHLIAVTGADKLTEWNDTHTHAQVIAAFDAAIKRERTAWCAETARIIGEHADRIAGRTGWESVGPSDCQIVGAR